MQLSSQPTPLVLDVGSALLANISASSVDAAAGGLNCSVADSSIASLQSAANWSAVGEGNWTVSMQLMGHKFGWTDLSCTDGAASGRLQLTVLQPSGPLDIAYRVLLILFVVAIVFCMGANIDLRVVLRLVKRPVALSIGWACQFLLMPHLGLAVGQLLLLALAQFPDLPVPNALAFGLLTFSCSPGGSGSNMWTYLLDGDLDLSMTMTFFSNIWAFFMMPLWLFAYGRLFIESEQVLIPFDQVAYTLLQSVVSLVLGVLVRHKWPRVGKKLTKAIGPLSVLFVLTVAGFGSYVYFYLLELLVKFPIVIPFAGMLPWLGFLLSYLITMAFRLPRPQSTAVALECGVQNAGIPIQLLLFSMAKPEGDIASIVPVAATILTPVPLYFTVAAYRIWKRCKAGEDGEGRSGSYELKGVANAGVEEDGEAEELGADAAAPRSGWVARSRHTQV
ncbi:hypothetical protein BOX15_Mlig031902g2 [Macrostomum lignano]|uniref:Uncharacterized protein n=2 Tax=Macrostomum lignano TaxID=282301 RepID=A0A267FUR4_9PLAT|nr:hypothetical protein BOX15_Mlig031902g2 [Macrostomum lignano]